VKNQTQVTKKLRRVVFRHYQRYSKSALKPLPSNCAFNQETSVDFPDGTPFCVCNLLSTQELVVDCNRPEQAQSCRSFIFKKNLDSLYAELIQHINRNYRTDPEFRDVRSLLWVLGEATIDTDLQRPNPFVMAWVAFWGWLYG